VTGVGTEKVKMPRSRSPRGKNLYDRWRDGPEQVKKARHSSRAKQQASGATVTRGGRGKKNPNQTFKKNSQRERHIGQDTPPEEKPVPAVRVNRGVPGGDRTASGPAPGSFLQTNEGGGKLERSIELLGHRERKKTLDGSAGTGREGEQKNEPVKVVSGFKRQFRSGENDRRSERGDV